MIYLSSLAKDLRAEIDTVIFDMDGVLLDTTDSIRVANVLAVPYYLREVLGWPAPDDLLTSQDIELFKHAGGFNDDEDLTCALVLHYLVRSHEQPDASPEILNVIQPNIRRYAGRLQEKGGGLKLAEELCLNHYTREDRLDIEKYYRKDLIRKVFKELWAGEHTERLYGKPATLFHGVGLINKDKPLLDKSLLPANLKLGILTGRIPTEAQFGLEMCDLADVIPAENVGTPKDGFYKPSPGGLLLLNKRLESQCLLYIGDALDDYRTVANLRKQKPNIKILSSLVLTGPAGEANTNIYRKSGADVVAKDVNEVMEWIAQTQ